MAAPPSPRLIAIRRLARIDRHGAFINLAGRATEGDLSPVDRRLATELVAGVTRWRRWLDFLVDHFYRGDPSHLALEVREVLRLGLYDLLLLRTPAHAAVHQAVEVARAAGQPRAAGLVNAVLRAADRSRDALPAPRTGDAAEDLAIVHSHPTWLVRRWLARFGTDGTAALLAWNNARPLHALRANTLRATRDEITRDLDARGIAWQPAVYLDTMVRVPRLQPVLEAGLVARGLACVQDESAALVVHALDPRPGETVVDTCAAPGGKSLYAAERMRNEGRLLAFDAHPGRIGLLAGAAARLGITIVETATAELRALAESPNRPTADRVLLDAPCTGTGVLAKRADARWRRHPDDLSALAALQRELLDAAALLVRPGGLLVYSTCSMEPEENEAQVEAFLSRHGEFKLESPAGLVPPRLIAPEGWMATLPQRDAMDGAFAARLRRIG